MKLTPEQCYSALAARDARFDGRFFVGVTSTRIYCRPVCRVRMPGRERCRFFAVAASAEAAGYRPCLRCRPELAPGSTPLDGSATIADRAVARIEAGALSEIDVAGLAAEFGIGPRQLRRLLERDYGVTPIALAQTRRLLLAKQLLADTRMPIAQVALASGFSSVRRFNHLFRTRYRLTPSTLRNQHNSPHEPVGLTLKLGYRPPLDWSAMLSFLTQRGANCLEQRDGEHYLRTMACGPHQGWITVAPAGNANVLDVTVSPGLAGAMGWLRSRLRQLFDLDACPQVIAAQLCADARLAPLLEHQPGLRIPGAVEGFELALRAIVGQQISVPAATTVFTRFVRHFGTPVTTPAPGLDRLPPRAEALANADLQQIIDRGVPRRRAETIHVLAQAMASGTLRLGRGQPTAQTRAALQALPGIGPWTAQYIGMRALGDPDAFPAQDLGLARALGMHKPQALQIAAEAWRPWRAYAAMHLWHSQTPGG